MKEFLKDAPAINLLLIYLDVATYFSLISSYLDSKTIKHKIYTILYKAFTKKVLFAKYLRRKL